MSVALRALAFTILALAGGVGVAYAPALTFTVVALAFAAGLLLFARSRGLSLAGPEAAVVPAVAVEQSEPRGSLVNKLVSGYLLLWWLALVAPIATYSPRGDGDAVQAAGGGGSLSNQVLVISFGLVGALFLPAALKRLNPIFLWVAIPWMLYLGWALISLYWSEYPPLTFRNVAAFGLITVGSFGLGAGFYGASPGGRDLLLRHLFIAGVLSALMIIVPLPFRWGQFDLLSPTGRLDIGGDFATYVARPVMCTVLAFVMMAVLGIREWQRRDLLWLAFFAIPLLALKARGPVLWAILAFGLFYLLYKSRIQNRILQVALLVVSGFGVYVYYSRGLLDSLILYLARGDLEYTASLSSRLPLWDILLTEVEKHPWIGVGFAAFWDPDSFARMELLVGRSVVSAHNGYLEEVLSTGLVGLILLLVFLLSAILVALTTARRGDPFGWIAFVLLGYYVLLNMTNSLVQDFLQIPFLLILATLAIISSEPAPERPPPENEAPNGVGT